jgi:ribonuclease D
MRLIDSLEQSNGLVEALRYELSNGALEDRFLAVDTEFIRENLEQPLLCLVQLATASEAYVLDAISLDVSFLHSIFGDETVKKVFHSPDQDLDILLTYGLETRNFQDTQLMEMLLDVREKVSYQSLVFKYLGKRLKKGYSLSNWKKRPLDAEQLVYSAEDVTHLREVYKKQVQELSILGRLQWLDGEWEMLTKNKCEDEAAINFRNEKNLSVFNRLMKWRDQKAMDENLLPERIAKDETVRNICRRGITLVQNMKNARHIKNAYFKEFLSFAETIPELLEIEERSIERNTVLHLLRALLEICSEREKVAPTMMATVRELEKLSTGAADVKCLESWRYEIFGKHALALLQGNLALGMKNSRVEIRS